MSIEFAIISPFLGMETEGDIRKFFAALYVAGINFHPEDSFSDIGHRAAVEWVKTFSAGEAAVLDEGMARAYEITRAERDIVEELEGREVGPDWRYDAGRAHPWCYNGPHDPCAIACELMEDADAFVAEHLGYDVAIPHIEALATIAARPYASEGEEYQNAIVAAVAGGVQAHFDEPDEETACAILDNEERERKAEKEARALIARLDAERVPASEYNTYPDRQDGMG